MWLGSFKAKRDILSAPLRKINFIARWTLKFVLFMFGRLIYIDNPQRLKNCPWPAIFALNHNNYSESILVPCTLILFYGGKLISFLVHWVFKLFPFIGWMLKQINPIWIYNRRARVGWINKFKPFRRPDIFEQARLRLRQGQSIGIFPEGTRNNNPYKLMRGRMGLGRMVLESHVPVLPIGIDFPGKDRRRKIPVLGKMILKIGKPLYFTDERKKFGRMHGSEDENETENPRLQRVRTGGNFPRPVGSHDRKQLLVLYAEVSHRIMKEISGLCGKKYPY